MRAHDEQSSLVFSGVFSIVWIGEAIVTLQIKLLGGNMYVFNCRNPRGKECKLIKLIQLLLPIRVHHRIHLVPFGHRRASQCTGSPYDCANPSLSCPDRLVSRRWSQYSWWLGRPAQSRWYCCLPIARLLHFNWMPLLYQLADCSSMLLSQLCINLLRRFLFFVDQKKLFTEP
jgi:hypothetical protein